MEIKELNIQGLFEIRPKIFRDKRGSLIKTFHNDTFKTTGLNVDFKEEYYSVSHKGVLRGMHFQIHPYQHVKCVTCLNGSIFDVILDLRKESPTYLQHFTTILDSENAKVLYIPEGCAHGFYALTDNAIFLNRTTEIFKAEAERGIRWNSFGVKWPNENPIVSEKDSNLQSLDECDSVFSCFR